LARPDRTAASARPRASASEATTLLGVPRWTMVVAAGGALLILLPLLGMLLSVDWAHLPALVTSPAALAALGLSLRTAAASTALCVLLGVPMALVLARTRFPGQRMVRALVLLPLVLPPVVGGLALLATFGRRGLLGETFDVLGIQIAFSTTAVVLAQTFVALPFLVLSVEATLRASGARFEAVAATLGADPGTVFRRVTVPLVLPGLVSGAVLAFARALGEFGATLRRQPRGRHPHPAAGDLSAAGDRSGCRGGAGPGARGRRRGRDGGHPPAPGSGMSGGFGAEGKGAERQGAERPAGGLVIDAVVASRGLDVSFTVADGETVALLGSNGAGKSTVVQVLAGLLRPDRGRAVLDGRVLFDLGGPGPAGWLPPHGRGTALLAQEPLLFPHLSVRDNVAFGPRSTGSSRARSRILADEWLAAAGVTDLADRRPAALSGGQAQRVAVARALAARPGLLLLDEPMTALDVAAVPAQRRLLHDVLADRTVVLITHDPLDALALADRVIVLENGRVAEQGRTRAVFARPQTEFTRALTFGLRPEE
jgi:molybdate transport system permease protein